MTQSMTGFCKASVSLDGKSCFVEMRSVNHRFLEARVYLPKPYALMEEELKKGLKNHLSRGKVDVTLTLEGVESSEGRLAVDPKVWGNFKSLHKQLESELGQPVSVGLSDLFQIKGLLVTAAEETGDYDYLALFQAAIEAGARLLKSMRGKEGALLKTEMLGHLNLLESLIQKVPEYSNEMLTNHKQRLTQSLAKLELELDPDDPRVLQEIGFLLDRADVTEEVERFTAHLSHFRDILEETEPVGRKLDFLIQELNREANTLCSKAGHPRITEIGVTLKSELEKIREQVQNIE